jgi:hypothetical protein
MSTPRAQCSAPRRARRRRCRGPVRAWHPRRAGGGESFPRVDWVAVPEAARARRLNNRAGLLRSYTAALEAATGRAKLVPVRWAEVGAE